MNHYFYLFAGMIGGFALGVSISAWIVAGRILHMDTPLDYRGLNDNLPGPRS